MKDTKNHILTVALGLFLKKNFKEVTMQEIVRATKLSKGAFYHYFSSKEQLFQEVIETFYLQGSQIDYSAFSSDSLYDFYNNYLKHLSKLVTEFENRIGINGNWFTMLFDAINHVRGFDKKIKELFVIEVDAWKKIVRIARKNGEIESPMTDEQIAKTFIFINDGLGMRSVLEGRVKEASIEMKGFFDGLYKHLKA